MNKLTPKQISKYSKIIIKTHNGIHERNLPLKTDMIKYMLLGHDDHIVLKDLNILMKKTLLQNI